MGNVFSTAENSMNSVLEVPELMVDILKYGSILVGAVLVVVGVAFAIAEVKGTAPRVVPSSVSLL